MSVPLFPRSAAGLLGCLAAVVNGVLRVAIVPVFVTPLFDRVLQAEDPAALPGVLAVAALVAVGGSLALWAQDALLGRAAARLAADWRRRLYRALLDGPPGRLPGSSGGLASRIVNDLREVETYYRYGLGTLVAESVTLVLILVLLVRADALAALALLALALPSVLALRWVGGYLERAADRSMAQSEAVGRHLQEGLKHHELVRAFGARRFMQARFEPANRAVERAMSQRSLIAGLQTPLTQVLVFGAIGVLVVFLVNGVQRGSLTIGDVIAFLTLVALAATPTQLLPHGYAHYRQARAAAERLARLAAGDAEPGSDPATGAVGEPAVGSAAGGAAEVTADTPPAVTFAPLAPELAGATAAAAGRGAPEAAGAPLFALDGVAFAYRRGGRLLEGVDLALPRTGLVVVSGASGSGKTTLLRLLLRFDAPVAGEVRLGGEPLSAVEEAELRRRVAYVPQDHGILSGPLREVLAMGREASDAALWAALNAVGLAAVVRALPDGLGSRLGEDGGGLSGGQRQRLAIARALLGDPEALLLDEPTSNLDDLAEREIVALLARLARQRLVLAVTHRPALAEAADLLLAAVPAGAADQAG